MNPFQSDNIWKKKARQGKAQQHPLTPQQEWQKQVNSSSLWLGGGVVLLALYLAAVRAGTVALDASAVVLIVVVGCFCVYTAASLGRLMKNKPEEKAAKKKKKAKKSDRSFKMAPRALRHKQRNYYFCILQSRNDCGHSGFAFSREGVVTGSGICFANRSAAQKSHWGLSCPAGTAVLSGLFWRAKENVSGGNAFYKSHTNLPHTNTHCTRSSLSS